MTPPDQVEQMENKSESQEAPAAELSGSLWDDMKQTATEVKHAVGKIADGILDFSDDIYGDNISDLIKQQTKPLPLGDVQPGDAPNSQTADELPEIDAQTMEKAKDFNIDDYQSTTMEDGTQITTHPDGTVSVKGPDGTHVIYNPDGSKFTSYPDGTTVSEESDGTKWTKTPDGKMHSEHQSFLGKIWDMIPSF